MRIRKEYGPDVHLEFDWLECVWVNEDFTQYFFNSLTV